MTEKDILICGHGSGNPSTKNMYSYLQTRQNTSWNGSNKGLVEVRRFLTEEQSKGFADWYKKILGRNIYNQNLRQYVFDPYTNGKYYSDCSSSGCACYKKLGKNVWLNTAGMHSSGELVDVKIVNGHIADEDLRKLRPGDALLFRGNSERVLGIGHVEYIYQMPSDGNAVKEGWVESGDDWYYYENGKMLKKKWLNYKNHWYRFGNDGKMLTGWHKIYDKDNVLRDCYFEEKDKDLIGAMWHEVPGGSGYLEIWTTE